MCLYTFQSTPKVAEEDIICYKVLTKDLKSPCYGLQYELGNLITSELKNDFCDDGYNSIEEGLHTLKDLDNAKTTSVFTCWRVQNAWINMHGVNAPIIVKCIIPKGSLYYEGDKEFVSNQLIPQEIVYDATENAKN